MLGLILMPVLFKVGFNSLFIRLIPEYLERSDSVIQKGLALFCSAVSGLLCDVLHRHNFKLKIKQSVYLPFPIHIVSKHHDHLGEELLWETNSGMESNRVHVAVGQECDGVVLTH